MSRLEERKKIREKKKKKLVILKIISVIIMINVTMACLFYADYNMNIMLNKEPLIKFDIRDNLFKKF